MTFRLMGIPEELRLEIEQNGGGTTEAARLIIENAVQQAQATTQDLTQGLKEIQAIIGPHGSITRLQAGGLNITPGLGLGVYGDGVIKTHILPSGTFAIGSNIEDPAYATEVFFVEDTVYNNEQFNAGDFLIGDNSASKPNLKYNAAEGRLEFRIGQTVNIFQDTEGALTIANNVPGISFLSTDPTKTSYLKMDSSDVMIVRNSVAGKAIHLRVTLGDASTPFVQFGEDSNNANVALLTANTSPTSPTRFTIGGTQAANVGVDIWANSDGKTSEINDNSYDIDFRIEGSTEANMLFIDAGNNRVGIGTGSPSAAFNAEGGAVFNDFGADVDHRIEGDTDANLTVWDAGLDAIGMGGAAESGYKLKVTGDEKVTGSLYSGGWTSYNPSWSSTGGTQPSLGNGTLTGKYVRNGAVVIFKIKLVWGNTTTGGTGTWIFTSPVTFADTEASSEPGKSEMVNIGVAGYEGGTEKYQSNNFFVTYTNLYIDASTPFTWGDTDILTAIRTVEQ